MAVSIDLDAGVVRVGDQSWPLHLDGETGGVCLEVADAHWSVRPLRWREKLTLARFAHSPEFVRRQMVRLALAEQRLPDDAAVAEALTRLALWVNAPHSAAPDVPLDAGELATISLSLCRTSGWTPAHLDALPAWEVEWLWQVGQSAEAPSPTDARDASLPLAMETDPQVRIVIVPDAPVPPPEEVAETIPDRGAAAPDVVPVSSETGEAGSAVATAMTETSGGAIGIDGPGPPALVPDPSSPPLPLSAPLARFILPRREAVGEKRSESGARGGQQPSPGPPGRPDGFRVVYTNATSPAVPPVSAPGSGRPPVASSRPEPKGEPATALPAEAGLLPRLVDSELPALPGPAGNGRSQAQGVAEPMTARVRPDPPDIQSALAPVNVAAWEVVFDELNARLEQAAAEQGIALEA